MLLIWSDSLNNFRSYEVLIWGALPQNFWGGDPGSDTVDGI